jgi:hypothetical protein
MRYKCQKINEAVCILFQDLYCNRGCVLSEVRKGGRVRRIEECDAEKYRYGQRDTWKERVCAE